MQGRSGTQLKSYGGGQRGAAAAGELHLLDPCAPLHAGVHCKSAGFNEC